MARWVIISTSLRIHNKGSGAEVATPCSNVTPIFIGLHRNATLSPMKRVPGYTTPMKNMAMPPMDPMHLLERIRALVARRAAHPRLRAVQPRALRGDAAVTEWRRGAV
jgi:hypothetical protein